MRAGLAAATAAAALAVAGCGDDGTASEAGGGATATAPTVAATTAPATTGSATTTTRTKKSASTTTAAKPDRGSAQAQAWSQRLCTAMTATQKPVNPPQVDPSKPEAALASVADFLGEVAAQVGAQRDQIAKVGPPPGAKARRAFRRVLARLDQVEAKVAAAKSRVSHAQAANAQQLNALFRRLGKDMADFASYSGPVRDLIGRNADLAKALSAEPACKDLR